MVDLADDEVTMSDATRDDASLLAENRVTVQKII
jgi:hypothetical protein